MLDSENILPGVGKMVVLLVQYRHFYPLVSSVTEPSAAVVSKEELYRIMCDAVLTETAEQPHVLIRITLRMSHAQYDVVTVYRVVHRNRVRQYRVFLPACERHRPEVREHRLRTAAAQHKTNGDYQ